MTTTTASSPRLDFDRCYRALQARDARFDGQFFVTVRTTGIYCRPSCPAQTPRPHNVDFVPTAATAQARGFRACRRCLPDAVPGSPQWNRGADLSARAMRLIADGTIERDGVAGVAQRLGYSPRHLTRVLTAELGAGPLALARAYRATNARILIQCTSLPMADVAFAAGFASVRQFNDTIRDVFALTPTALRAVRHSPIRSDVVGAPAASGISLRLAYREPMNLRWLAVQLGAHAVAGIEQFDADPASPDDWRYRRVLTLPHGPALIEVRPQAGFMQVGVDHLDLRDLGVAVNRIRRMLDLDADVCAAEESLSTDRALASLISSVPGLRLPGSADSSQTLIRTMIGQQISVKAARHHLEALVARLGTPTEWSGARWREFPSPETLAEHGAEVLTGPARRIDSIVGAARAIAENSVELHAGVPTSELRAQLLELPGIGNWTADHVALQITGDPDILLASDLVLRHAATDLGIDLDTGDRWAPWRSYASMHLWRHRLMPTP